MTDITYTLALDLDRDGFYNVGARPGDALNLLPDPLTHAAIDYYGESTTVVTVRDEVTEYGTKVYNVACPVGVGGLQFGRNSGTFVINDIPVSPSTQYTAVVWVRGISNYSSSTFAVLDQVPTTLINAFTTITPSWAKWTRTFTTGASSTHVAFRFIENNDGQAAVYEIAGFMLVAGSAAPTGFNAGVASNRYDNLSGNGYVKALPLWRLGMNEDSYADFAEPAELTAVLDNASNAFNPEDTAAAYYGLLTPGTLVRLTATDGTTTATLWTGFLKHLTVTPDTNDAREVVLLARDQMWELLDAEYKPDLLLNVRTDEALLPVFDRGFAPYPYAASYWMPGVVGSSELGTTTIPYECTNTDFDEGRTTLAFVGDNLDNGTRLGAQKYLRDIVASEVGGRFFWSREAMWTFHSRAHDILNTDTPTALDVSFFTQAEYLYAEDLYNIVTVNYQQREVGTAGSVLWTYPNPPLALGAGAVRTMTVRYSDPDNPSVRVAGMDMLTPAKNVDYVINTAADGSGTVISRKVVVSVTFYADKAEIILSNSDTRTLYVTLLQLRGTPLRTYGRESAQATDYGSIAAYEQRERKPLQLPVVDDPEFAQQIADFLVSKFRTPGARFRHVMFLAQESATHASHALTHSIGSKLTLTSAALDHEADYIIVGESHAYDGATREHHVTWLLAPHTRTTYWILGESVLGVDTRPML